MAERYDAVIIGGGHNGLTCGAYLARAGLKTLVLERREVIGGAAVSEEVVPGFKFSVFSYLMSLLHPKVIADLRLGAHGLEIVERPVANFLPLSEGDALAVGGELAATQAEVARQMGVSGYPTTIILDGQTRVLQLAEGYIPSPQAFLDLFEKARSAQAR